MRPVTVFRGGPFDGKVALGHPSDTNALGARFEVINRDCPVWVNGAVTYRRHVYQVVGRRTSLGGEEVIVEHIGQVPAAKPVGPGQVDS